MSNLYRIVKEKRSEKKRIKVVTRYRGESE